MEDITQNKVRRRKGEGRAQKERQRRRSEGKAYTNRKNKLVNAKEEPRAEVSALCYFKLTCCLNGLILLLGVL